MKYTKAELAVVNGTVRTLGAVGSKAVVPRLVRQLCMPLKLRTVLDYGAGPWAQHSAALAKAGWDVTAWELGTNFVPGVHDSRALERTYGVVMASNVLNVQPTPELLAATIAELAYRVAIGGVLVANYPASPRKCTASGREVTEEVFKHFPFGLNLGTTAVPILIAWGG